MPTGSKFYPKQLPGTMAGHRGKPSQNILPDGLFERIINVQETIAYEISNVGCSHTGQIYLVGSFQNNRLIDLLAILQKSLDRAIFLYNFIREVR